eukprot:Em0022g816a
MSEDPVQICTWVDLSLTDVERILESSEISNEALQKTLTELLGLAGSTSSKHVLIELDMYFYAILFAKKEAFSPAQLSAFFTILKCVHKMCISTPYDNMSETFDYFKALLVRHSVFRPPYSTSLYSMTQVKAITEYVLSTYFKHFKLYKYSFTKKVVLDLKLSYPGIPDTPESETAEVTPNIKAAREEGKREEQVGTLIEHTEYLAQETKEEEPCSPQKLQLQQIIQASLTEQMKQLQASVEQELSAQEKKLNDRITALETSVQGKLKKGK